MPSFDPIWDTIYAGGQENRWPWSDVVSFVFRHRPSDKPPGETSVLEVGCGTAPNIFFLAAEGFQVHGIDASPAAIENGRRRLNGMGLAADLRVAEFSRLPFEDETFDLAIDRAALCHADFPSMERAIGEIHRVLRAKGKFLFTPFADSHSSFSASTLRPDGTSESIVGGSLVGVGQVSFVSHAKIAAMFSTGWRLIRCARREIVDMLDCHIHAEWIVVAEKI